MLNISAKRAFMPFPQEPIFQKRQALADEYHSKLTDGNRKDIAFPTLPDFPSTTDIIVKAEELKKFIDQA